MTKRAVSNVTPLADDPSQPSYVRELLEAGRGAGVRGYDFKRGLATHLTRVESGAPMPEWAKAMQPGAATAFGSLAASAGVAGLLAVPVVTAAVVAAVMLVSQPAATPTRMVKSVPPVVTSIAAGESQALPSAAATRPAALAPAAREREQPAKHAAISALRKGSLARPPSQSIGRVSASAPASAAATTARAFSTDSAGADATSKPLHGGVTLDTDPFASARPAAPAQPQLAEPESRQVEQATEQATIREPVASKPQPADDARLEREMGMLAMAERVLRSEPERALKLVRQGEAEFQGSMFTQERQQLLLLSLVELGRLDEARTLAKPYLARFPHGPFSDRVRRALASGKVER
jgi:hypothetical protein